MRKNLVGASALAIALAMVGGPANAAPMATFDFDGRGGADTPSSTGGTNFGEPIGTPTAPLVFSESGITLTVRGFTGSPIGSRTEQDTILDDGPAEGGLGVISEGSSSLEQVNTGAGESIDLIFSETVFLSDFNFNSGAHNDCPDTGGSEGGCGDVDLFVDGVNAGTFAALDSAPSTIAGNTFTLFASGNDTAFYVGGLKATVTSVPAPATIGLLGMALAGLAAAVGRRRKV